MAVTLRSIAAELGLSHATVSFVLNNRHDIAIPEATRERVKQKAVEMGYRPNRSARALARGRTDTIGVLMPASRNPYYGSVLDELYANAHCRRLDLVHWRFNPNQIAHLPDFPVDGYVSIDVPVEPQMAHSASTPFVAWGVDGAGQFDSVHVDLYEAAKSVTEYLVANGRRRILFLTAQGNRHTAEEDPGTVWSARETRMRGYAEVMEANGLESDIFTMAMHDRHTGSARLADYLDAHGVPDAIMAYNDWAALTAMRVLINRGVDIPTRCAVTGFDDVDDAAFFSPSLTTVGMPIADMATRVMELLTERIADTGRSITNAVFRAELIRRQSA